MKKILVRSPNWIGDQILAYPFYYFLRRAYPQAQITVVCVPWVESLQFKDLINDVILLPRPESSKLGDKLRALEEGAKRIRDRGPWDLGISLPNSFSAAWMMWRAGVRIRRGYSADGRGLLLTDRVRVPATYIQHRSQAYVDLLPPSVKPDRPTTEFWGVPAENELDEDVPGVQERFDALRSWPGDEIVEPPAGPYWVLAPGSTAESRRWPIERFAQLARLIAQQTGWTGVVVGGVAESVIADELCTDPSLRLVDLTAQGPVIGLWKVFSQAKFTVANDSGLAHVASLCGSPVQVVWGAGNPQRTRPVGKGTARILFNPIDCWPCERNTCDLPPGRQFECLKGVSPEAVWKEIQSGLKPKP